MYQHRIGNKSGNFFPIHPYFLLNKTCKHTELEGVDQYAITTRPISKLLEKIEAMEILVEGKKDKDDKSRDVIVVGSGAAGLELAWAFK